MISIGKGANDFRSIRYYTGLYDLKGEVSKNYFWKFKYAFSILVLTDSLSLPESFLFFTDRMSKMILKEMDNIILGHRDEIDKKEPLVF